MNHWKSWNRVSIHNILYTIYYSLFTGINVTITVNAKPPVNDFAHSWCHWHGLFYLWPALDTTIEHSCQCRRINEWTWAFIECVRQSERNCFLVIEIFSEGKMYLFKRFIHRFYRMKDYGNITQQSSFLRISTLDHVLNLCYTYRCILTNAN